MQQSVFRSAILASALLGSSISPNEAAQLAAVNPSSISVTLGPVGEKQVAVDFAFDPSPSNFTYSFYATTASSTCMSNPVDVAWINFPSDLNEPVMAHTEYFYDYEVDVEINGFAPGQYQATLCISTFGSAPDVHYAIPITLNVSDDVLFQSGFDF